MFINYCSLWISLVSLLAFNIEGNYRTIQIVPDLPHLRFPGLHLLLHLQKIQPCSIQIVGHLPIPDIDPIHLLGTFHQVSCQIIDTAQAPLTLLPYFLHIIPH